MPERPVTIEGLGTPRALPVRPGRVRHRLGPDLKGPGINDVANEVVAEVENPTTGIRGHDLGPDAPVGLCRLSLRRQPKLVTGWDPDRVQDLFDESSG